MRYNILFLAILSLCYAAIKKEPYYYPKESAELFLKEVMRCITKIGYDESIIESIKQEKYTEDDKTAQVFICACVNTGFGYENGRLNVEKLMKETFPTRQDVRPILEECDQVAGTPMDTFRAIVACYREKLPFKLTFS